MIMMSAIDLTHVNTCVC